MGAGSGEGAVPQDSEILDTYVSTKTKTFYPHGKCRTNVNNTVFAQQSRHLLRHSLCILIWYPFSLRVPLFQNGKK